MPANHGINTWTLQVLRWKFGRATLALRTHCKNVGFVAELKGKQNAPPHESLALSVDGWLASFHLQELLAWRTYQLAQEMAIPF